MKKFVPLLACLVLAVAMSCATVEGDKKIKDTTESIREKEAQARRQQREREEAEEDGPWGEEDRDYGDSDAEGGEFLLTWLEYASTVRFADYPYAPSSPCVFCTSTWNHPEESKFYALQLASSGAYHFDGTYGILNRLTVQLTSFHFNLVQQNFFAVSEHFSLLSVNAGLSIAVPELLVNAYAGFYWLDFLDAPLPSFGLSSQLFLTKGFYLDLYNLNAVLESLWIGHLTATLNFALCMAPGTADGSGWASALRCTVNVNRTGEDVDRTRRRSRGAKPTTHPGKQIESHSSPVARKQGSFLGEAPMCISIVTYGEMAEAFSAGAAREFHDLMRP